MAVPVHIHDLVKRFGSITAVDHVTLAIEPGELFFLLGPSGCGKTTLLRSIAGFVEPDAGTIHLGDRELTRLPPHQRNTGMVFQSYALWPHLSVRENVAFGLEMQHRSKKDIAARVDEVLDQVRMRPYADQRPNQLSGGQQQRVALARALVIRPQCLLLDEPLSNLDAKLRLEMRGEIRRICKEAGLTAVYVTHDQKEALSIADRLAVLRDGVVLQVGTPNDVYRLPNSRFVAGFIGETNLLEGTMGSTDGECVQVSTPLGTLLADAAGGAEPGDQVSVSLRPEAVRIGDPPSGVVNILQGTAHDTVYLGEVAQHRVTMPQEGGGERDLHAFELNPRHVVREGAETVKVWIESRDVIVLKG